MAKQLNLLPAGQVIPTALHTEMQRSYLEYAMSVIVGRALPDVRDGLKPVHRRILYAMHELGLTPDRPYRKCARVVGDVLGKYHPHGDQAVYDALVRLVQDFSSRYPLLAGHGNFGSVDNDPPAAMRYTETRLAPVGNEAMLTEIGEETVDFIGNFDNSQQEPVVLPAQLPFLLLNGASGIAVGMATNIPPHNLGEIIDGLVTLIDQPELSDDKLFELIPGPDFPTGGEIIGSTGIREAYTTGRGSITIRGIAQIEEIQTGVKRSRRTTAIVVTELPYQVNKAGWIEKVAELVNQGRIEGIGDLRDESDRQGMRVVIELKRDADPQVVLRQLYHHTSLQTNFGAIFLALVDQQPRQLSLRQLLQEFLNFREQTLIRRYTHDLNRAESRAHLVEGLLTALSHLDEVITILRQASDGSTAKITLQNELQLSEAQADAILAMPMRRLTGLEQKNLQTEFESLSEQIQTLRRLLSDRHELLKALKKDLRSLRRKFADSRRTRIGTQEAEEQSKKSSSIPNSEFGIRNSEEVALEFTQKGYVRRLAVNGNKPGRKPKSDNGLMENDFVIQTTTAKTDENLVVFTSGGKVYPLQVGDIPPSSGRSLRGTPLIGLLPGSAANGTESIVTQLLLPAETENIQALFMTQLGRVKRLAASELQNLTNRGLTVVKFKDEDRLLGVQPIEPGQFLILASAGGRLLRFGIDDEQLPILGRTAMGMQGLRLRKQEEMVGGVAIDDLKTNLLLVTQEGYAKRIPAHVLRQGNRGDIPTQALAFSSKSDRLAGIVSATVSEVALLTSNQRIVRLPVDKIGKWGKEGTGDRLRDIKDNERIVSVIAIPATNSLIE
ncbi:MAG: DNA gyrase subunit A [Chroococcidiopsis cubana SAG 39.79]|jgi:DNA gyrase subunit A|uniref:DNA topoisomerase (ATP-hydrolyzing) n=2 Tax=Chroococcidiopsis TaxID=54298 RepID=K9TSP9_CHRTP|nr:MULTISPECIES: DNA gyrase subunit A [Chroococcidiopsis]AFY85832.1 DNA topoisomerase IV subunit A [Chroococcidiopsis thermalis PCC 7203]MDZ4873031.1 DNA gyrase subunit A [Chroococcidiopsis cubana SAG 39.79]PSB63914.1 DNA gyrase subunit A [Chroococcidiopsis cubana CCALA 043]RUT09474.1 DNA topoisomerase (ATP-hydrolyzing) [Chroococcidiopsis cubana SAG 39.79]